MARETQLDTHEIDKLLDDDDFIDDFDFSEDLSDQLVDADSNLDGELAEESDSLDDDFEFELDEPEIEGLAVEDEPVAGGAGVVASEDELDCVALEIDGLDFGSHKVAKVSSRGLKIVIGVAVVVWLVQFFLVIYLLKQPLTIRDEIRPLAVEIDLSQKLQPVSESVTGAVDELVVAADPAEPDIFLFNIYLPLYSLEGLKVFSAEIEVVQFQESGRLVGDGQKKLQESLRLLLQEEIGERLREEIVDVKSHLTSLIAPHIEAFFNERQVDLSKVKIRIHNPYVQ